VPRGKGTTTTVSEFPVHASEEELRDRVLRDREFYKQIVQAAGLRQD